jgi:hypothetical protein
MSEQVRLYSIPKQKWLTFIGVVGSIACGDQLKFQVSVDDEGVIQEAVFKVNFATFWKIPKIENLEILTF